MRVRLISGIVAALLLMPVAANADDIDGICYADPLAEVCTDDEVLAEVDEKHVVDSVREPAVEVEAAEVLGVSEELAVTGIDTWALLVLALGLLTAGGLTFRGVARRQSETAAR